MKIRMQSLVGVRRSFSCALLSLLFTGFVFQAQAQIYAFSNLNSVVKVDTSSSAGLYSWEVDGVDLVNRQWFYYRIGSTGPEYAINTIGTPTVAHTNDSTLDVVYANSSFSVSLHYMLTGYGDGSGNSGMVLTFAVKNISTTSLAGLHFFQYTDYDLNVSGQDDLVQFFSGAGARYNKAIQTSSSYGITNSWLQGATGPKVEAALAGVTLPKLSDGNPTTLSNTPNVVSGNLTYAMQWDLSSLGSGSALSVTETITLRVPEPSCLALAAFVFLFYSLFRRRC
jgi:hypothetical protein